MWQDYVFATCQLAFVPAMLPALRGADKPPTSTSVMNAVLVTVMVATQATLGLWFSVATGSLIALTWATLALQKMGSPEQDQPSTPDQAAQLGRSL